MLNSPACRSEYYRALGLARIFGLLWLGTVAVPFAPAAGKTQETDAVIYPRRTGGEVVPASGHSTGYAPVLGVALLLAAAGGWLLWRGRAASGATTAAMRQLAIVETKSLGNRQFLVVASYKEKKFLLGICPGRVDLLTQLEGAPAIKPP